MLHRVSAAIVAALLFSSLASDASAQTVKITQSLASKEIVIAGQPIRIARKQDTSNRLEGDLALTSRPCPGACIQPMMLAPGVQTLGELELITFLDTIVAPGRGLLLDTRLPSDFEKASIPGAVNLPFSTLQGDNPHRPQIFQALGGVKRSDAWDFSNAFTLSLFCGGPWCGEAAVAAQELMRAGYAPEKLTYYRGGLQNWMALGFTSTADQP